MAQFE